jgi:shikimate kinase
MRIFLIGPMGAGKTSVGRQLASLLGLKFIDSDAEIEKRTGVDIPFIFEKEGEEGFREREREVIDVLTELDGIVLATGGGAVLREENRRHLAARGQVVYLKASIEQQLRRTRHDQHRPLLKTADPATRLKELMVVRAPLYESIALMTVPTDGRHVKAVAQSIIQHLASLETDPQVSSGTSHD